MPGAEWTNSSYTRPKVLEVRGALPEENIMSIGIRRE
jgi:hypothetical protein